MYDEGAKSTVQMPLVFRYAPLKKKACTTGRTYVPAKKRETKLIIVKEIGIGIDSIYSIIEGVAPLWYIPNPK